MTTKQNEAQHTPTPWAVYHWHQKARNIAYVAPAGLDESVFHADEIATLYPRTPEGGRSEADANAEFIVRAVNSHAALVEALEDAKVRLETIAELARQAPVPIGQDIYNNAYAGKIRRALDAAKVTK